MTQVLALFENAETAAGATEALQKAGYEDTDFEILTDSPYPEGAFGERESKHKLYVFPFVGALLGFSLSLLIAIGTQAAFPLVTGGKPILSIPPMIIIGYELTLMGTIWFTVMGIFFESRLPNLTAGLYDPRITEGYIGIIMNVPDTKASSTEQILREAGAEDVLQKGS